MLIEEDRKYYISFYRRWKGAMTIRGCTKVKYTIRFITPCHPNIISQFNSLYKPCISHYLPLYCMHDYI